ncbi:MAG: DivIVA domain-containing protein [Clostridiales bacterium]|nr:DivIVA domain-containing protein [Clostridiales bacterium]
MPDGVVFAEQQMGYDKQQVDSYIASLTYEYQSLHNEYLAVVAKCNTLSETCARLSNSGASGGSNTATEREAIARALIDAEMMAKQIVDGAKNEARRFEEQINQSREQLKQVQLWKDKAMIEVHDIRKKINSFFPE